MYPGHPIRRWCLHCEGDRSGEVMRTDPAYPTTERLNLKPVTPHDDVSIESPAGNNLVSPAIPRMSKRAMQLVRRVATDSVDREIMDSKPAHRNRTLLPAGDTAS